MIAHDKHRCTIQFLCIIAEMNCYNISSTKTFLQLRQLRQQDISSTKTTTAITFLQLRHFDTALLQK